MMQANDSSIKPNVAKNAYITTTFQTKIQFLCGIFVQKKHFKKIFLISAIT